MNKLVPFSDFEILARVAQRRALKHKIQQEEINDQRLALDQYIADQLDAANIDKTLLSDSLSREVIFNALKQNFVYTQTPEHITKISNMKTAVNEILSDSIKSERWSVGDCKCILQRIYMRNTPEDAQTFHAIKCNSHEEIETIDELHDTINVEVRKRSLSHFVIENISKDISVNFTWEGKNKHRILIIDADVPSKNKVIEDIETLLGDSIPKGSIKFK